MPWISIYAEHDNALPVQPSIAIMREQLEMAGNDDYHIEIVPDTDHGFRNIHTHQYQRVEQIAIDWIQALD